MPMLSLEFFTDIILPAAQGPIVMKCRSLNLLERSGPIEGLSCLLRRLTTFICCEEMKRWKGGGRCFSRVETRRNEKKKGEM